MELYSLKKELLKTSNTYPGALSSFSKQSRNSGSPSVAILVHGLIFNFGDAPDVVPKYA